MILLGPSGHCYAYLMNRAMAKQLLQALKSSHAKDFVNVANFFSLQCNGTAECEQVKLPLVHRNDSLVQRLQNLIQVQIPHGGETDSRNPSRRTA